jgi:hypothetical protein
MKTKTAATTVVGVALVALLVGARLASAQTRVVVRETAAPVFVQPDATLTPLRVAKAGSVLNAQTSEGERRSAGAAL